MVYRSRTLTVFSIFAATLIAASAFSQKAHASLPAEVWVTPHLSIVSDAFPQKFKPVITKNTTIGNGLQLGTAFLFDEFFALNLQADIDYQYSDVPENRSLITSADVGFRYTIDLFQYVPYTVVSFGAASIYDIPLKENHWDAVASIALGINYRYDRHYSFGMIMKMRTYLLSLGEIPLQYELGAQFTYHFKI